MDSFLRSGPALASFLHAQRLRRMDATMRARWQFMSGRKLQSGCALHFAFFGRGCRGRNGGILHIIFRQRIRRRYQNRRTFSLLSLQPRPPPYPNKLHDPDRSGENKSRYDGNGDPGPDRVRRAVLGRAVQNDQEQRTEPDEIGDEIGPYCPALKKSFQSGHPLYL